MKNKVLNRINKTMLLAMVSMLILTVMSGSAFAANGTINVSSIPDGANLSVDGVFIGPTTNETVVNNTLDMNRTNWHYVQLQKFGYYQEAHWVFVPDGLTVKKTFNLTNVSQPRTTPYLSGTEGNYPWYKSNVKVELFLTNPGGLPALIIEYSIDGGATWLQYTSPINVSTEGWNNLSYRSRQTIPGGIRENDNYVIIPIDKTPPTLTASSEPNANGWYNSTSLPIHFTCTDNNWVTKCPADVATAYDANVTAEDGAGNSVEKQIRVDTDKPDIGDVTFSVYTPPTQIIAPWWPPSEFWFNQNVIVNIEATDNLSGSGIGSGIESIVPPTKIFENDGTHIPINGVIITDKAGNKLEIPSTDNTNILYDFYWTDIWGAPVYNHGEGYLNIDKTAPLINITPDSNVYNTNIDYKVKVFDPALLSTFKVTLDGKVNAPKEGTITEEGIHILTANATDSTGNLVTETRTYNLDKTAPVLTYSIDKTPNANGWYNSDVTITFTATDKNNVTITSDALVGTNTLVVPVTSEGKDIEINATAVDIAGNNATPVTVKISIDKTKPEITGKTLTLPNGDGWYDSVVTVHFICNDDRSGEDTCSPDTILSAEGAGQSVTGTVTDKAGNTATAIVEPINIDLTAPIIATNAVNGKEYTEPVKVDVNIDASTSGVKTQSIKLNDNDFVSGTTISTNGLYVLEASVTDKAGRSTPLSKTFTVKINQQNPTLNIVANPSTVQAGTPTSVTFTVTGNGVPVSGATVTLTGAASATLTTLADGTAATTINAASTGLITATASKAGFNNGATAVNVEDATGSGEGTASGSGTILSPKNKKVTLKLSGVKNIGGVVKGKLKYTDSKAKITINGKITDLEINGNEAIISGITTKGLDYTVTIVDNGSPGKGKDELTIEVPDSSYEATGLLKSGNLVVKEI